MQERVHFSVVSQKWKSCVLYCTAKKSFLHLHTGFVETGKSDTAYTEGRSSTAFGVTMGISGTAILSSQFTYSTSTGVLPSFSHKHLPVLWIALCSLANFETGKGRI